MKSAGVILYDFQKAINDAEVLENAANKMRCLAENDIENSKRAISVAWQGESSEAYQRKCVRLQTNILNSAKDLKKQAEAIRSMAKRTYEAEMRAYRLANDRNY